MNGCSQSQEFFDILFNFRLDIKISKIGIRVKDEGGRMKDEKRGM